METGSTYNSFNPTIVEMNKVPILKTRTVKVRVPNGDFMWSGGQCDHISLLRLWEVVM